MEDRIYSEVLSYVHNYLYRRLLREGLTVSTPTLAVDVMVNRQPEELMASIESLCLKFERTNLKDFNPIAELMEQSNGNNVTYQMQGFQKRLFRDGYSWSLIISLFAAVGFYVKRCRGEERQCWAYVLSHEVALHFRRDAVRFDAFLSRQRWNALVPRYRRKKSLFNANTIVAVVCGFMLGVLFGNK